MKRLSIFFLLFLSVTLVFAQQQVVVTGTVTDESNLGLPGVTILEKGTSHGTITNFDGEFSIEVPAQATLVFSFVGFTPREIPVQGRTVINVQM
ncbi:MAG TPA: TonB-dependent receptor, partial [Mariniphaga anaerophila]|nr:TonB-dependent receptor [Mariniphaga anaerophila]